MEKLSEAAKQARRQYKRAWDSKHRDEVREYNREYMKAWRQKNREKIREYARTYWERQAANYTPERRAKELHEQGYTQRQIARELGVSAATVNKLLNKK